MSSSIHYTLFNDKQENLPKKILIPSIERDRFSTYMFSTAFDQKEEI